MSLILSTILLLQSNLCFATASENPNPGPRSLAEPKLLLSEANEAYSRAQFNVARRNYERLIDRYPSDASAQQAYPKLIFIYADVDRNTAKTISTIQKFLFLKPNPSLSLSMKNKLAQAYFDAGKFVEAKTTANEILSNADASPETKLFALITKAEALSAQQRHSEALSTLDSISVEATTLDLNVVKAQIPTLTLKFKTRECSAQKLPLLGKKQKNYSDEQVLAYFKEKDACLKKIIPTSLQTDDTHPLEAWCKTHQALNTELKNLKIDSFLKQKISGQLVETDRFAQSMNKAFTQCKDDHADTL